MPHLLVQKLAGKCDSYYYHIIHSEMHLKGILKDIVILAKTHIVFVKTSWSGQIHLWLKSIVIMSQIGKKIEIPSSPQALMSSD